MSESTFTEIVEYRTYTLETSYYEKGNQIGKGGFSRVYQVRKFSGCGSQFIGQIAILKELSPQLKSIAECYDNQIKILKILNGQYSKRFPICLSYWQATRIKKYYVVLERCSYGSLRDFVQYLKGKNKALKQLEIIFLVREILRGVKVMHGLKMIHRDLKLDNIMIDKEFNIKIIDFGLTKLAQPNQEQPFDNKHNGSLFYKPPQMLRKQGNYSYQVDIWAVGVIMYYLMFQRYPFNVDANTPTANHQLLNQINQFVIPIKKNKYSSLKPFLELLLQKDRKSRPANIKQLLQHNIFQQLEGHDDIAQVIQIKHEQYFQVKDYSTSKWTKNLQTKNFEFPLPQPVENNPELKAKAVRFALSRSLKCIKVKIINLIKDHNYGFFILLSNLSLIGYFNNRKIVKFNKGMASSSNQSNQQNILYYMYLKYFKKQMVAMEEQDNELIYKQPQCTIKKLVLVKDNLFVRLTNHVLQVFFQPILQKETLLYQLSLLYNANTIKPNQIVISHRLLQDEIVYQDYDAVLKTKYARQTQYVKNVLELMIDNLPLSFQKMNLVRVTPQSINQHQ